MYSSRIGPTCDVGFKIEIPLSILLKMLSLPIDLLGIILAEKESARPFAFTCKTANKIVRGLFYTVHDGVVGKYHEYGYGVWDLSIPDFYSPYCTPPTALERDIELYSYSCDDCSGFAVEYPHISIGGAMVHPHLLAFAIKEERIISFDKEHAEEFGYMTPIFGRVYTVKRLEIMFPGYTSSESPSIFIDESGCLNKNHGRCAIILAEYDTI